MGKYESFLNKQKNLACGGTQKGRPLVCEIWHQIVSHSLAIARLSGKKSSVKGGVPTSIWTERDAVGPWVVRNSSFREMIWRKKPSSLNSHKGGKY